MCDLRQIIQSVWVLIIPFSNDKIGRDDSFNNNKNRSCCYMVLMYITWIMPFKPHNNIILSSSFYRWENRFKEVILFQKLILEAWPSQPWLAKVSLAKLSLAKLRLVELPDFRPWLPLSQYIFFRKLVIINSFVAPLEYMDVFLEDSCQFYNLRVSFSRTWEPSFWIIIIKEDSIPSPSLCGIGEA